VVELLEDGDACALLSVVFVVADEEGSDYVPELLITLLHSYYNAWQTIITNLLFTLNWHYFFYNLNHESKKSANPAPLKPSSLSPEKLG